MCISLQQIKDDYDDDDSDEEKLGAVAGSTAADSSKPSSMKAHHQASAIDITADEIVPLLTPENVANLVLLSMVRHSASFPLCALDFSRSNCSTPNLTSTANGVIDEFKEES